MNNDDSGSWLSFDLGGASLVAMIITAFLAGIFSIIPNVFDKVTAPRAALSLSVISGPVLKTDAGYVAIYSLTLANSGKTRLTGVRASAEVPGGRVEQAVLAQEGGDQPVTSAANGQAVVQVRSMLPTEKVTTTFQMTSPSAPLAPKFSARSEETLGAMGVPSAAARGAYTDRFQIASAVLGMITAALAVLTTRLGFGVGRQDTISFVGTLIGTSEATDLLVRAPMFTTYALASDIIASQARRAPVEDRNKYIQALKTLLLVPRLNPTSRRVVEDNLKMLGATLSDEERSNITKARRKVRNYSDLRLQANALALPQGNSGP